MPCRVAAAATLLLVTIGAVHAQSKLDRQAVHELPRAFCAAFNEHDGHRLAELMAEDVDFVVVGALLLHGKPDFETYHTRLLDGRFHAMTLEPLQVAARFLRPDIAIVHWTWTGAGDKNPDGTARERRYGMFTMVAEKRNGNWLIAASQNDGSFPGLPPEFDGMTTPLPLPDQVGRQPDNP
jgi:uncharacterized protein (TIGR02246 family)